MKTKLQTLSIVVGLLGFTLLVAGVAQIHGPSGLIVAGCGLLLWSQHADKVAARINNNPGG